MYVSPNINIRGNINISAAAVIFTAAAVIRTPQKTVVIKKIKLYSEKEVTRKCVRIVRHCTMFNIICCI